MKVRSKLIISFTSVICMLILVGYSGSQGIQNINHQNKIGLLANRSLVDAQDAQANSLRYIIYNDDSYHTLMEEELNNVIEMANEAYRLMKSEDNRENTLRMETFVEAYKQNNEDYYQINMSRNESGVIRVSRAGSMLQDLLEVIDSAKEYSIGTERYINGVAYLEKSAVERVWLVQESRNTTNRFRIAAQKYQLAIDPDMQDSIAKDWITEIERTRQILQETNRLMHSAETKEAINNSLSALAAYKEQVMVFRQLNRKMREVQVLQKENASNVMSEARNVRDGVAQAIENTTQKSNIIIIVLSFAALIFSILLGLIITKSIEGPVLKARNIMEEMAKGNLSFKEDFLQKDEIGDLGRGIGRTAQKLNVVMGDIRGASRQVAQGAEQISSTAQQLSSGASEQASSTEEISSSMEELAANIQQNTENSQVADEISSATSDKAVQGGESVQETVLAMRSISEKISVIEDIARNTNMLALNAAIEAARAGDAGKGFAVVAAEVRKLAEHSGKAAAEITAISSSSVIAAENAGTIITELVPNIQKIAELIREITYSSQEQATGAEQINSSIQQLDMVIQQNASSSEEMASMAEELNSQSETMESSVAFFRLAEDNKEIQPSIKVEPLHLVIQEDPKEIQRLNTISDEGFEDF